MVALSLPDPEAGRRHVTVIEPMIGGGGGRPGRDGIDGCDASLGFLKTTPAETLEAEVPIVVRRFHLVADSAGPGRFRGGHAVRLDFQVFRPEGLVTARGMERLRFAPWGVAGGTRRRDGQRRAEPRHRRRARAAEDRGARAGAGRRAERADAGRRRPRRSASSARRPRCSPTSPPAWSRPPTRARRTAWCVAGDASTRRRPRRCEPSARSARDRRDAVRLRPGPPRARASLAGGAARRVHRAAHGLPAPYRAYVRRTLYPRVEALADQRPVTTDDLQRLVAGAARRSIGLANVGHRRDRAMILADRRTT